MSRRWLYILTILTGALILASAALIWPQAKAEAQCGSQASSCKNCHEVQAKKPVNNDGTSWHQSHAFGDFCANCHGGNVQATDETAAHAGMVDPLSDIQANCASCHPDDTQAKAQTYATILGVSLNTTSQNTSVTAPTPQATSAAPAGTPAAPAPTTVAAANNNAAANNAAVSNSNDIPNLIDYNEQYAETVQGKWPINWGNVLVGVMIVMMGGGGGAFVYFNERKLRGPVALAKAQPAEAPQAADGPVTAADLLPQLEKLDPRSLKALKQILREPRAAGGLLISLARLDPKLIEQVRQLDRSELSLLIALAEEK